MKNITKDQKDIIIKAGVVLSVFLIIWIFLYIPLSKKTKATLGEISIIEEEIKTIADLTDGRQITGETIIALKNRLKELVNKFPQGEEEAIRESSLFAKKCNVELVSLEFSPKKIVFDDQGKTITVDSRGFQKVSFFLELVCTYEELLRYLEVLKNNLSAFISIDRLSILKIKDSIDKKLEVKIHFDIYLLS